MEIQRKVSGQLYGIDGEPFEFGWNTLPRLASLEFLRKIQEDVKRRNIDLEKFEDRIIFMSMFNGRDENTMIP